MSETTLTSPEFRPSPLAKAIRDVCDPDLEHVRLCCECLEPAELGSATCERIECKVSLHAALYVDLDGDEGREP